MTGDQAPAVPSPLIAMLRRHLRLIIVCAVLAGAAGIGVSILSPASYTATATVLVAPLDGNPYSTQGRGDDLINLETEAQLVSTDAVNELAEAKTGHAISGAVSVSVPPNTQVLNISHSGGTAQEARDAANAYANAYLAFRQQQAQAIVDGKLRKLEEQSKRIQRDLQTANRRMSEATKTSQRSFLKQRIDGYTNQLSVIEEQSNDASSTPLNPGQVITPAQLPSGTSAKRMVIYGGGGMLAGLMLAVAIAVARESLDRRLRRPDAVDALGVRALAVIPESAAGDDPLPMVSSPDGERSDAYRRLRAAIVAATSDKRVVLLVASATPGGSSTVASSNLAVAMAFAGSSTIMVDAGTSMPEAASLFGLRPQTGLSDTLIDGTDPATLLIHADPQLRLLPRGNQTAAARHRFSGPLMRRAVKVLNRRVDMLVINAPSMHDADGQALCTLADLVLLIVTRGVTTRDQLQQAAIEVERAGAKVIGAVIEPSRQPTRSRHGRTAERPREQQQPQPVAEEPDDGEYFWTGMPTTEEGTDDVTDSWPAAPQKQAEPSEGVRGRSGHVGQTGLELNGPVEKATNTGDARP